MEKVTAVEAFDFNSVDASQELHDSNNIAQTNSNEQDINDISQEIERLEILESKVWSLYNLNDINDVNRLKEQARIFTVSNLPNDYSNLHKKRLRRQTIVGLKREFRNSRFFNKFINEDFADDLFNIILNITLGKTNHSEIFQQLYSICKGNPSDVIKMYSFVIACNRLVYNKYRNHETCYEDACNLDYRFQFRSPVLKREIRDYIEALLFRAFDLTLYSSYIEEQTKQMRLGMLDEIGRRFETLDDSVRPQVDFTGFLSHMVNIGREKLVDILSELGLDVVIDMLKKFHDNYLSGENAAFGFVLEITLGWSIMNLVTTKVKFTQKTRWLEITLKMAILFGFLAWYNIKVVKMIIEYSRAALNATHVMIPVAPPTQVSVYANNPLRNDEMFTEDPAGAFAHTVVVTPQVNIEVRPQMSKVDVFTGVVAAAVAASEYKNLFSLDMIKKLGAIGNSKRGISELIDSFKEIVKTVGEFLSKKFGLPNVFSESTGIQILDDYYKNVQKIEDEIKAGKFYISVPNLLRLEDISANGEKIMRTSFVHQTHRNFVNYVVRMNKKINDMIDDFKARNVIQNGLRHEPFCVMLFGKPGIMKSANLNYLANFAVLLDLKNESEFLAHMACDRTYKFNRQFEVKFWEGLENIVKVIMIDDYGQAHEDKTNPENENMGLIRLINTFLMDTHMASIDKKGKLQISPIAIIATTNRRKIEATDIYSPEAVRRRINGFYATIKPEYRKNPDAPLWSEQVDPTSLPRDEKNETKIVPEIFLYYHYDHSKGEIDYERPPLDFEGMKQWMTEQYMTRLQHFKTNQRVYKEHDLKYYEELKQSGHYERTSKILDEIVTSNVSLATEAKDKIDPHAKTLLETMREKWSLPGSWDVKQVSPQVDTSDSSSESSGDTPVPQDYLSDPLQDRFRCGSDFEESDNEITMEDMSLDWNRKPTFEIPEKKAPPEFSTGKYSKEMKGLFDRMTRDQQEMMLVRIDTLLSVSDISAYKDLLGVRGSREPWKLLSHLYIADKANYEFVLNGIGAPRPMSPIFVAPTFIGCIKNDLFELYEDIKECSLLKFVVKCFKAGLDFVKAHPVFTALSVVGGLVALYKMFGASDEEVSPQSMDEHSAPKRKTEKPKRKLERLPKVPVRPQVDDKTAEAIKKSVQNRNLLMMGTNNADGTFKHRGYVLMIEDTVAICNLHYVEMFKAKVKDVPAWGDELLVFKRIGMFGKHVPVFNVPVKDFLGYFYTSEQVMYEQDIAFFQFPRTMSPVRSIVDKFIPADRIASLEHFTLGLDMPHRSHYRQVDVHLPSKKNCLSLNMGFAEVLVDRWIEYDEHTNDGDCGIPLIVYKKNVPEKILGIHFAVSDKLKKGYGTIISQEEVREFVSKFKTVTKEEERWTVAPQLNLLHTGDTALNHLLGTGHTIVPSVLQRSEVFEAKKAPSMVEEKDGISPMRIALAKYKGNTIPENLGEKEICFTRAKESMESMVLKMPSTEVGRRILTLEEALWGIPGSEYIDGINSASSAGAIHKRECPNLKKVLFNPKYPRCKTNPGYKEISDRIEKKLNVLKSGKRIETYYTWNLKLELLKKEKVRAGKSRSYNGSDFDTQVLFNMYFGAFFGSFVEGRIENESSIGINPHSIEWEVLSHWARKFQNSRYPKAGAGDFAKFDMSHFSRVVWLFVDWINKWYGGTEEETLIRTLLWYEIVFPVLVLRTIIFEPVRGQPSGNKMTQIVNCFINSFLFRYCFYRCLQDHNFPLEWEFRDFVALSVHGDDNFWTEQEWLWDFFNEFTIPKYMAELDFEFTSETKEQATTPFRTLDNIEYLKRGFRYEPLLGIMVAPLRKDTIEEMILWTKTGMEREITITNIETALREAALWDDQYYEDFKTRLIKCINESDKTLLKHLDFPPRWVLLKRIFATE